jgi:hypothetical protein
MGAGMGRSRRWRRQETELGETIVLLPIVPREVLAEREAARAAELTPNIVVLGDPLPGRSALDARHRLRADLNTTRG